MGVLLGENSKQKGLLPPPLRFQRILSIILEQNPDVVTMQELDHHADFMEPELKLLGYEGIFQPKHSSVAAKYNGGQADGVAIFWNTQRIKKIEDIPLGWKGTGSLHNEKEGRAKQVALAVKLQIKGTPEEQQDFIVITAHVKSGKRPDEIPCKEAQGKEIARYIAKYNADNTPVIFACDFNNQPPVDCPNKGWGKCPWWNANERLTTLPADVHCPACEQLEPELVWTKHEKEKKGKVTIEYKGTRKDKEGMLLPALGWSEEKTSDGVYTHPDGSERVVRPTAVKTQALRIDYKDGKVIKARPSMMGNGLLDGHAHYAFFKELEKTNTDVTSAYNNVLFSEPDFTTDKWRKGGEQKEKICITKQTIDYIFYTKEFECSRVLNLPGKNEIEEIHLPGWKYPSDHFMIAADLTLSPRK